MHDLKRIGIWTVCGLLVLGGCTDDKPPTEPGPIPIWTDFDIGADAYLTDRFFTLDDPSTEAHGRSARERIRINSIKMFQFLEAGPSDPGDVPLVAAYIDRDGFRTWPDIDFVHPGVLGARCRPVTDFDPVVDIYGGLVALDLRHQQDPDVVLAVVYLLEDETGMVVGSVGDDPELGPRTQQVAGLPEFYYRMKLLKANAAANDPKLFSYVQRNIYSLGAQNLNPAGLELRIEALGTTTEPAWATPTLPWIQLFGLDQRNLAGGASPDGLPDLDDPWLFDLQRGLIRFPLDNPRPFAADRALYEHYAAPGSYSWQASFLAANLAPELYSPSTDPADYPLYRHFAIRGSHVRWVDPLASEGLVR